MSSTNKGYHLVTYTMANDAIIAAHKDVNLLRFNNPEEMESFRVGMRDITAAFDQMYDQRQVSSLPYTAVQGDNIPAQNLLSKLHLGFLSEGQPNSIKIALVEHISNSLPCQITTEADYRATIAVANIQNIRQHLDVNTQLALDKASQQLINNRGSDIGITLKIAKAIIFNDDRAGNMPRSEEATTIIDRIAKTAHEIATRSNEMKLAAKLRKEFEKKLDESHHLANLIQFNCNSEAKKLYLKPLIEIAMSLPSSNFDSALNAIRDASAYTDNLINKSTLSENEIIEIRTTFITFSGLLERSLESIFNGPHSINYPEFQSR